MTKANALGQQLASYVVSSKLSGQVLARRTGALAESVQAVPATLQGNKISFGVQAGGGTTFYAKVFEEGTTSAYPIVAVNARALSFIMDGQRVFMKRVTHPPFKARPFLRPSAEEMMEYMRSELQETINEENRR